MTLDFIVPPSFLTRKVPNAFPDAWVHLVFIDVRDRRILQDAKRKSQKEGI
jgi:hypothetical protein